VERYTLSIVRELDVVQVRITGWRAGFRWPDRVQVLNQGYYRPVGAGGRTPVVAMLESIVESLQAQQGYTHQRSAISPYEI